MQFLFAAPFASEAGVEFAVPDRLGQLSLSFAGDLDRHVQGSDSAMIAFFRLFVTEDVGDMPLDDGGDEPVKMSNPLIESR